MRIPFGVLRAAVVLHLQRPLSATAFFHELHRLDTSMLLDLVQAAGHLPDDERYGIGLHPRFEDVLTRVSQALGQPRSLLMAKACLGLPICGFTIPANARRLLYWHAYRRGDRVVVEDLVWDGLVAVPVDKTTAEEYQALLAAAPETK